MPSQMEQQHAAPTVQPRQILQNPNRHSGQGVPTAQSPQQLQQPQRQPQAGPSHRRGPSYQGPIITSPQQILQLSDEDRAAFLMEEAKRAKRNHKIATMAKGNGFMTPQDKNFVSRLQLTQLMAATGNVEDQSAEARLNDDFYYQVYTQIRGGTRQNPHQPANQFAQTYLFQTGNRYGGGRRYHRGGDNSMQRMEQQVQRAVEVARQKQKPKDLNFAGSLGKIAFSNSKTPRPLLNIKTPDNLHPPHPARRLSRQHNPAAERRETLRNIENIYLSLMAMEDHERQRAPLPRDNPDTVSLQRHMEWRETLHNLNKQLWNDLKVMEPVNPG
jgi:DNA topoisomerase 2-associated protein PAT1